MSTLNVGAMAARLGLDPADFLDKMKGVEGFTSGLNQRMSAEMKRTSREGAESFRLIDEALGIHVSRPLTKILTTEFPAFAKALQSLVGVGVVGALAAVAFEFGAHIAQKMGEAKRKEEEYADAVRETTTVIAEARAESQRRLNETLGKDAGVRGDQAGEAYYKGLATDAANVERLAKFTDQLAENLRRDAAAAAAQMPIWLALQKVWHDIYTSEPDLAAEKLTAQMKDFQEIFAKLAQRDALKHTATSAEYLNTALAEAAKKLDQLTSAAVSPPKRIVVNGFVAEGKGTISPEEIAAQVRYLDLLNDIKNQQKLDVANAGADKKLERDTEAKALAEKVATALDKIREKQKAVQEESVRLGNALHQALDKNDEVDRLDASFKTTMANLAMFRAMVGGAAFFKEFGVGADQLAYQLSQVTGQLESQAQLKRFLEETKEKKGDVAPAFPLAAPAPAMPTLVHGGGVAGELAAFAEEPRQQIEMMKKAFAEALTPVEKFTIAQRELDLILKNSDGTFRAGAEGAAAYAGAMRHITEEEEKAEAASRKAMDGVRAFWLEMQHDSQENGKFTFTLLSTAFNDFETGIAKTILATANQHAQLRRMWEGYFKSLEEMALKYAMTKSFASLANLAMPNAGAGANAGAAQRQGNAVSGWKGILEKVLGLGIGAAVGGPAGLSSAAQMFFAAGGGAGQGQGGAPVAMSSLPDSIPMFAEGGDVSPGASFISGEAGAEEVNLNSRGGAHITPLGVGKGGGDTHYHFDQRGAVVTEDLVRRAEAAQMMRHSSEQSVARAVSMSQEIAKRSRPAR